MNTFGYPSHMSDRQVRNDRAREYVRELTNEEIDEEQLRLRQTQPAIFGNLVSVQLTQEQ